VDNERFFPIANLIKNKASSEVYDITAAAIKKMNVQEVADSMRKYDVPCAVAQTWQEMLEDKQAWANGCYYTMKYDNGSVKTLVRPPVTFQEMGEAPYKRGPLLGEHGPEVLKDLGYSQAEIDKFLADKDVFVWKGEKA
jgi:cinnamoyl-CoA:phenyllactate CoA-transferase